jgi:hypothetical protein
MAANHQPGAPVPGAERMQILEETFRQRDLTSAERNELIPLISAGNRNAAWLAELVAASLLRTGYNEEGISYMFQIIGAVRPFLPHSVFDPRVRGADGGRRRTRRSRRTRRHHRK